MILTRIKTYYERQLYRPSALAALFNPFFITRRGLMTLLSTLGPHVKGRTLDVGCGTRPYADLFHSAAYVGLELDTPANRARAHADCFYDGVRFPFADGSFDSVVSNQVLEHVSNPDQFLGEIHRVLSADGVLLLTAPFIWDEHEQPHDYRRYTSYGMQALLERHHFHIIRQQKSVNDIRAIFQMLILYIYKKTVTRHVTVNLLTTVVMMAPLTVLSEILNTILPNNDDLYLDNGALATKRVPSSHHGDAT